MSNRHYVDRLADVREQMRVLKKEEDELREFIISKKQPVVVGSEYIAHVIDQERNVVDLDKVKVFLADKLSRFMKVSTSVTVKVVKRKETDGDDFL